MIQPLNRPILPPYAFLSDRLAWRRGIVYRSEECETSWRIYIYKNCTTPYFIDEFNTLHFLYFSSEKVLFLGGA